MIFVERLIGDLDFDDVDDPEVFQGYSCWSPLAYSDGIFWNVEILPIERSSPLLCSDDQSRLKFCRQIPYWRPWIWGSWFSRVFRVEETSDCWTMPLKHWYLFNCKAKRTIKLDACTFLHRSSIPTTTSMVNSSLTTSNLRTLASVRIFRAYSTKWRCCKQVRKRLIFSFNTCFPLILKCREMPLTWHRRYVTRL